MPANRSYVVFGGTFDPIHEGHISAIRNLLQQFDTVIVAPTERNPWKELPMTSLSKRVAMIELVLNAESLPFTFVSNELQPGLILSSITYVYAEELVQKFRHTFQGNLHWAIGEDQQESVERWRNWQTLQVPIVSVPIEIDIHSTAVRQGESLPHPAIRNFIDAEQLYRK